MWQSEYATPSFFISFAFGGWSYTWLIFIFGAFAGKIIDIFFGD